MTYRRFQISCVAFLVASIAHISFGKEAGNTDPPNLLFIAVDDLNTWALGLSDE